MEPFLPPAQPADNPAPKKKGSAVMWWVILIIICVAIYDVTKPSSGSEPVSGSWSVLELLASGWPFLLVGGVIYFLWWQFRGSVQFHKAQEPGLFQLAEGQLEQAAATFRAVTVRYRRQMQYSAVARYNLAIALFRAGKLESAITELIAVEKGAGLLYAAEIRLLAAIMLGECYALRGELDASRRWIDEARKRMARGTGRIFSACLLTVAQSVLECRAGHFDEAARLLDRDWRQLEGNLTLPQMRVAQLMRAYLVTHLEGPRGEGLASPYLSQLRGAALDYLAVEWPELRTFLTSQGFSLG